MIVNYIPFNVQQIKEIANAFYLRNQADYAIAVYEQGKVLMEGTYTFNIELATMYERNGNFREMVETYLDHLEEVPEARDDVQNRLQTAMAPLTCFLFSARIFSVTRHGIFNQTWLFKTPFLSSGFSLAGPCSD